MFLAHFSDLHLPLPCDPAMRDLLSKRALGFLSWSRNRRFRHKIEALNAIADDLQNTSPTFTAITGDIVNISLPEEFKQAIQWLEAHFEPATSGYCPGNHDAYVPAPWFGGLSTFGHYMSGARIGEPACRPPSGPDDFPYVRIADLAGIVFANSSPPTLPFLATGELGRAQIARIGAELENLGRLGRFRVLAIHHPVTDGAVPARKALVDRKALQAVLHDVGVELVLHGHTHFPLWARLDTKDGPRPVAGVGSASHPRGQGRYRPARYNLFDIGGSATEGWRLAVEVRELDPATGEVKTAERRQLLPA